MNMTTWNTRIRRQESHWARRAGALLVCACSSLVSLSCGEEPIPPEPVVRPVKILELDAAASGRRLEYPGTISAAQESNMAFEVPGRIVEFPVVEGQRVDQGAILARLDPRDYQARLDSENAELSQTKAQFERYRELFERDVVSRSELDLRERAFGVAEAAVREAEKAVEDTSLRAPFPGVVARKLVEDQENVQAKEPVVLFHDDSSLQLVVNVPERDLAQGRPGSTLEEATARVRPQVVVTSLPDRTFPARIVEFSTAADPVTRTFRFTLAFATPKDVQVLPGMTAKVAIIAPRQTDGGGGYTVPTTAVLANEGGDPYVWIVDPSSMTVRPTSVVLGELTGSEVEVTGGLEAGDLVAVSGVRSLREGMQVRRLEN